MLKAIDVSAAVFVRGLNNLKTVLRKGEVFAEERGIDPSALLDAHLAADMFSLAVQAHWAAEGAKLAVARLLGAAPAPLPDDARTFAAIHDRLDAAIASLEAVDPDALEAGLARTIEIPLRGGVRTYRGDRFITEFAVPGFFFHVTTAYGILRREGVPLNKGDFMGA
ncbi:MAG: DUF1993 domain-containing protein [Myxococcaceae bacterium]|nr:MAG: DUF1993 domain-containing protein [Myxococcaceae bacterium]